MRTFVIVAVCAALVGIGVVGSSWAVGPHKQLQNEIDAVLSDDLGMTNVSRNFSPYCAIGSCPKVSAQSTVRLDPGAAVSRIQQQLLRRGYAPGDGDPVWKTYRRGGTDLKYRVDAVDGEFTRVFWEIKQG